MTNFLQITITSMKKISHVNWMWREGYWSVGISKWHANGRSWDFIGINSHYTRQQVSVKWLLD
jgi:hypothetical protein